jgi:hypothetical protein
MRKTLTLLATLCALGLPLGGVNAGSATWSWPTQRTDNTALPLSAIGGFTVYDTSVATPGLPGNPVTGCAAPIPPTTATGSCTTAFVVGHIYAIVIGDTATPPNLSAPLLATATGAVLAPPKAPASFSVVGP